MKRFKQHNKVSFICLIVLNLLLLTVLTVISATYMEDYKKKLFEQNLNDIININHASASIASGFFSNQENNIKDIIRYNKIHNLKLYEFIEYIYDTNANNEVCYQLIGEGYSGYIIEKDDKGKFPIVNYSHSTYNELQKVFEEPKKIQDTVMFSCEFTDQVTGSRSFARYIQLLLEDDQGNKKKYTLMAVTKSSYFVEFIKLQGGFNNLSTGLIDENGNYVLRNLDYKSDNLFQYIYLYNNLTLDEKNKIKNDMISSENGELRYLNSAKEECVFVYIKIPEMSWYCVSSVPISSFHYVNRDISFTFIIIGIMVVIMIINISYLYELNSKLKNSIQVAYTANEAKTDFLSRMSHDIRTPINVITGMTELALSEKEPEQIREYITNIQSSGKFLLGLVNDILDMNKVESGSMELHKKPYAYAEFKTYINAVIVPLGNAKNIKIEMKCNIDNIILMIDSLRFNQIAFNILSNAVKFTAENGHIKIQVNIQKLENSRANIELIVIDDGTGMSEEFQKKMFDVFSQEGKLNINNANGAGTGLGLPIVKKLVELMGGNIRVESAEGKGTKFYINIETEVVENEQKEETQDKLKIDLENKCILLCEDHPMNTMIIVKLLEKKMVKVETAENGKIGTDMFENSPEGYYDAVLMDIHMPVMNGLEATKRIRNMKNRKDANEIPIIALTANAYDSDVKECMDAGMNEHLAKPVEPIHMYQTINKYINQNSKT